MANRQRWQLLCWLLAGSLIGMGFISMDVFFIGLPCLLAGIGLLSFGGIRWGARDLWLAGFSGGLIPVLFLFRDILMYNYCAAQRGVITDGVIASNASFGCGPLPDAYYAMLFTFGTITIGCGLWPLLRWFVRHTGMINGQRTMKE